MKATLFKEHTGKIYVWIYVCASHQCLFFKMLAKHGLTREYGKKVKGKKHK
jgi:hypothetical protein